MTYAAFQAKVSSEKLTLATVDAARRLVGWVAHSGSVYKLTDFVSTVIIDITDSGSSYTAVSDLASVAAGKYYHDRDNEVIYLQASDSSNPNSRFLVLMERYFFSDGGAALPWDLSTGYVVDWAPMISSTSQFGVALDNVNQLGVAIEGAGKIDFLNDQDFWSTRYDKLFWENKKAFIYSWSRELAPTDAKLIYRGRVQKKAYNETRVSFQLKDYFHELRASLALSDIGDISGALIPDSLDKAKQRRIYGKVSGFRPTNVDQVLDGYTLPGTVTIASGSTTLTGSGTSFLTHFSPDDQIQLDGVSDPVTIESVTNDTSAVLTEAAALSANAKAYALIPDLPKRYANRDWILAGHSLREPSTTVTSTVNTTLFTVGDTTDFNVGDTIAVGTEVTTVKRLVPTNQIKTQTALALPPSAGTTVKRLSVYPVYIDDKQLTWSRDYTYNATNGTLTLDTEAERNIAQSRRLTGTVSFNSASRTITGTNTVFTSQLTPNSWVRLATQSEWLEVLAIASDTSATIRTLPSFTDSGATLYKAPAVYREGDNVVSCTVLGATENGTTSGVFIRKGPQVVKDLLIQAGLSADIESTSFATANDLAYQDIGIAVPERFDATQVPTYRDIIDKMNRTIFGALVQNEDFELEYQVLSPARSSGATRVRKEDVISWSIASRADRIPKTINLEYLPKEYDIETGDQSIATVSVTSNTAAYAVESEKEKTVSTYLIDATDADVLARRWAFLLEISQTVVSIKSKLQLARLQVTDRIDFEHEKLYERFGGDQKRKIAAIQSAKKSGRDTVIEIEDLANAFNRAGTWAPAGAATYGSASQNELMLYGYWTDAYGMMDNDAETFGKNLWW